MITRKSVLEMLENNRKNLTKHQKKTIKGQLNAGDITGAYKGLSKILNRVEVYGDNAKIDKIK